MSSFRISWQDLTSESDSFQYFSELHHEYIRQFRHIVRQISPSLLFSQVYPRSSQMELNSCLQLLAQATPTAHQFWDIICDSLIQLTLVLEEAHQTFPGFFRLQFSLQIDKLVIQAISTPDPSSLHLHP